MNWNRYLFHVVAELIRPINGARGDVQRSPVSGARFSKNGKGKLYLLSVYSFKPPTYSSKLLRPHFCLHRLNPAPSATGFNGSCDSSRRHSADNRAQSDSRHSEGEGYKVFAVSPAYTSVFPVTAAADVAQTGSMFAHPQSVIILRTSDGLAISPQHGQERPVFHVRSSISGRISNLCRQLPLTRRTTLSLLFCMTPNRTRMDEAEEGCFSYLLRLLKF